MFTDVYRTLAKLRNSIQKIEKAVGDPPKKAAALLIGINYPGTTSALKGCVNDVRNVEKILHTVYGVAHDHILCLTDEPNSDNAHIPTKQNILAGIAWLLGTECESLWFHYSGHGTWQSDADGEEKDGRDECIVASDFQILSDDVLLQKLVEPLPANTVLTAFMDCCHSGTQLDLRYRYVGGSHSTIENPRSVVSGRALVISGCRDAHTSADAYIKGDWAGAMTQLLLQVLKDADYEITCYALLRKLRHLLKRHGYTQIPQISCSQRLTGTSPFSSKVLSSAFVKPCT